MSVLKDLRAELVQGLAQAGLTAYDYLPERLNPPAVLVSPGTPYIESGDVFGTYLVRHEVTLVTRAATNLSETEDLDALIETALPVLTDYGFNSVTQPYMLEANNAQYLAVRAEVTTNTEIGE